MRKPQSRRKKDCIISICVEESFYQVVKQHSEQTAKSVSSIMRSLILESFKEEIQNYKKAETDKSPFRQGNLLDYLKQPETTL